MLERQGAILALLFIAVWTGILLRDWMQRPSIAYIAPMPADGSAPPLPAPIEVGPSR